MANQMVRRSVRISAQKPVLSQKQQLNAYFESDSNQRFVAEGRHGQGGQASVYKVKKLVNGGRSSNARYLILKLADPARESDVQGISKERILLQRLKGCRHIVRIRDVADDPLTAAADDLGWAWIYLDALENGTLTTFMRRVKAAGLNGLPNRLLWRIFLCMIRACIAMAWPSDSPNMNETTIRGTAAPSGITHQDMHGDNFMFGVTMDRPDHNVSPILKLLDFGQSEEWGNTIRAGATGEQWNVQDLGIMMATLVTMRTDRKYTGSDIELDLRRINRPQDVISPASGILPEEATDPDPLPLIDRDIRLVIAACMADHAAHRPTLAELENWAFSEVCNTRPAYYHIHPHYRDWESDDMIKQIVQHYMFNPDATPTG